MESNVSGGCGCRDIMPYCISRYSAFLLSIDVLVKLLISIPSKGPPAKLRFAQGSRRFAASLTRSIDVTVCVRAVASSPLKGSGTWPVPLQTLQLLLPLHCVH